MKVLQTLIAIAVGCSSLGAFANSADISIVGTITPGACQASFVNDTVDYGDIRSESLSAVELNSLDLKQVDYVVTCDSPTAVATTWTDNRSSSSHGGGVEHFGLGMDGESKIGHYELTHLEADTTGDGSNVSLLVRREGSSWGPGSSVGFKVWRFGLQHYGYAASGTAAPEAFSTYSGRLELQAYVAPTRELDLSKDVRLDGSATLSLVYL